MPAELSVQRKQIGANKLLVVHVVLLTIIVCGTVARLIFPFYTNPLDYIKDDALRHFNNSFDVAGTNLESILNAAGFQIYLQNLVRIIGTQREMHALAMGFLCAVTPWIWYRWLREVTRNKTMSLFGFAFFVLLPSWFRMFGYFMDSVILLPLTGAALWLTWRAARKATWQACILAGVVAGAACATKLVVLPTVILPWLLVYHKLQINRPRPQALRMVLIPVFTMLAMYATGPIKVWTHTHSLVLIPDQVHNQRYLWSAAEEFMVTNNYSRLDDGDFVEAWINSSGSSVYPAFYPFSDWRSARRGRLNVEVDYHKGSDYSPVPPYSFKQRAYNTFENMIWFFFQFHFPEDQSDFNYPFPRNLFCMSRFIWFPITLFLFAVILYQRKRQFLPWYFVAITLIFLFQQSTVMEGRYKKTWEGLAIGTLLCIVKANKRYQLWEKQMTDELVTA